MRIKLSILISSFSVLFFTACKNKPEWSIPAINGDELSNLTFKNHSLNAVVFLAPGCPLSEASIKEINKLQDKYTASKLATYIVVPGKLFSRNEVEQFVKTFNIELPVLMDTDAILVKKLNATITPEYFLLDNNFNVLYSGAIDDKAFDNEFIRQEATINYADSAINEVIQKRKPKFVKTKAVGCFIEL